MGFSPILHSTSGGGGGGSVTSVGLSLPASTFSVGGSPVTSAGTLVGTFITQTAGKVLAGPASGGAAVPTWRALQASDVPDPVPTITGTRVAPSLITAAGGIAFAGAKYNNIWFVAGNGSAVVISASPQVAAGTAVGQMLILIGRNDTNSITLQDGNGLSLNGTCILLADSVLTLMWDGTNWIEVSRR